MPRWLTTAANAFRKRSEPPPQTYSLNCVCGRGVTGVRTRAAQRAVCPGCRSELFVLPASVYPVPRGPVVKKPVKPARPSPLAIEEASVEGRQTPTAPTRSRGRSETVPERRRATAPAAPRPKAPPQGVLLAARESSLARWRRKALSPLPLVLAGVTIVVAGTVWWQSHLRARDRARSVIGSAPQLAEDALHEGDLTEAAKQFAQLSAAVRLLGRGDSQARRWTQLARETAAMGELATASLHDIISEAAETGGGSGEGIWPGLFRGSYRNSWVLIDAEVSRADKDSKTGGFSIDFPLIVGEQTGKLIANLPIFENRVEAGERPRRIIFAAQLADCRLQPGTTDVWQFELRPDSSFLWANVETYELLDLSADDQTRKTLAEQAQHLGIEP